MNRLNIHGATCLFMSTVMHRNGSPTKQHLETKNINQFICFVRSYVPESLKEVKNYKIRLMMHKAPACLGFLCCFGSSHSCQQKVHQPRCHWTASDPLQLHLLWNTQSWTEGVWLGILGSCSQQNSSLVV